MKETLYGLHIGEHGFDPKDILRELKENCVDRGMNFVTIRPGAEPVPQEYFVEWARYLAEHRVYFLFLYAIYDEKSGSQFSAETVKQMREVAGEYFLGDSLGELGTQFSNRFAGYFAKGEMPKQDMPDMAAAKKQYIDAVDRYMRIERSLGLDKIGVGVVEASVLSHYNLEGGTTFPLAELMIYDPAAMVGSVRGAARAYRAPLWGTYIAHEWYAGHYHDDALKRKRAELEYKYAYMQGTRVLCHESGDDLITAHGRRFERESKVCTEFRNFINDFGKYIKKDERPMENPITKVAFVQGNLDAWAGKGRTGAYLGAVSFCQYGREEWSYDTPEWSWSILSEIGEKRAWWEFDSYAADGIDASALPPYGTYDLLPASAPGDVMQEYDLLIYCGFNTMTEEQLAKLEQFVENGGTLLMTAAHLNTSAKRKGEYTPIRNGDLSRLFGCRLTGGVTRLDLGVKFRTDSTVPNMLYPRALYAYADPLFAMGYVSYADIELDGGIVTATLEDSFRRVDHPGNPALIEHKLGKGTAILMTTTEYPGANAVYPLYRFLVRELFRAGTVSAKVKVAAPDAVRYTVYKNGTVYLLNTDFDATLTARVVADGFEKTITLPPLALYRVETGTKIS